MKKNWLLVAEVSIAVVGLIAWWWSDNIGIVAVAAVMMFAFGVAKPLFDARRSASAAKITDQQYQRAESQIDQQMDPLLENLPGVLIPLWPIVRLLKPDVTESEEQLTNYHQSYGALVSRSNSPKGTIQFDPLLKHWLPPLIARQIQGILAFRDGDYHSSAAHFQMNLEQCPDWAEAWYGWLLCEHLQENRQQVAESIPYLNGIELSPLAPLDEAGFCELSESERERLTATFQSSMAGIGDLYAIAMMQQSRDEVSRSRAEYRDAA